MGRLSADSNRMSARFVDKERPQGAASLGVVFVPQPTLKGGRTVTTRLQQYHKFNHPAPTPEDEMLEVLREIRKEQRELRLMFQEFLAGTMQNGHRGPQDARTATAGAGLDL